MFPKILKKLREQTNLTQQDLAQKLNLSSGAIGMYEQGRRSPDISILIKIADFFDVEVDYLLGRKDISNKDAITFTNDLYNLTKKIKSLDDDTYNLLINVITQLHSMIDKHN